MELFGGWAVQGIVRKKEAPERLPNRAPDDEVRPLAPVSAPSPEAAGKGPGPVAVGIGITILSAGALMAALAVPRSHATASQGEVRAPSGAVRALAEEPAPPPEDVILTRFPVAPVPTTVRVVPNPHPPRLGGAMMVPMDER